jgi:hypothetical protein
MPRRSSAVTIARPVSASFQRHRVRVASIQGAPGVQVVQQTFPVVPRPSYRKAGVRVLRKVDVSKGMTMPEGQYLPFVNGVVGNPRGGFNGVRILRQKPVVPPRVHGSATTAVRVVAPPSPTNRGGVRNPFNKTQRVGRSSARSKRY